jgi:hypothetical protein
MRTRAKHCPFQLVGLEVPRRKTHTRWLLTESVRALGGRGQFDMRARGTLLPVHVGAVHVRRCCMRSGAANGTYMALSHAGARQVADRGPRGRGQEEDRQQHRECALAPHATIIALFSMDGPILSRSGER